MTLLIDLDKWISHLANVTLISFSNFAQYVARNYSHFNNTRQIHFPVGLIVYLVGAEWILCRMGGSLGIRAERAKPYLIEKKNQ